MKRFVVVLLVASLALSGCATLADKVGIANKAYADKQAGLAAEKATAASQERIDAMRANVQAQLDSLKQDAEQVKAALASVDEVVASMAQMKDLAKQLEGRLATLPEETLRKIVEILSAYLAKGK